jgi:hypothetical protein
LRPTFSNATGPEGTARLLDQKFRFGIFRVLGGRPLTFGVKPQRTYVHASDDDLAQGRRALARIHKIA